MCAVPLESEPVEQPAAAATAASAIRPSWLPDAAVLASALTRAVTLARRGPDNTANPQVGCVLVDANGRIIAEGWHLGAGTPHAEVAALAQLRGGRLPSRVTAVVTLEPCNHTGRTGPCAERLVTAGVDAVVYGVTDPTPPAAGGAAALQQAGVFAASAAAVLGDVGAGAVAASRVLLEGWRLRTGAGGAARSPGTGLNDTAQSHPDTAGGARPYTILKWAQSLDGRALAADGSSQWLTGPVARADVHRRRAAADAIAVGTGTLIVDNPSLTARDTDGELLVSACQQPVPVIFGNRPVPQGSRVLAHPALGARGLTAPLRYARGDLAAALTDLRARGISSLFVEGGPQLISAFLKAGLADELLIYTAPLLLGGPGLAVGDIGVESIARAQRFHTVESIDLGADLLFRVLYPATGSPLGAQPPQTREEDSCLPD